MKNVFQITTALFLVFQTMGYSQTNTSEPITKDQDSVSTQDVLTEFDTDEYKDFVGTYFLAEADFELEIIQEDNELFIISPFSKDKLVLKNETTLREPTRGVDLQLIENDNTALKFSQNGYVTNIKRINSTDSSLVKPINFKID